MMRFCIISSIFFNQNFQGVKSILPCHSFLPKYVECRLTGKMKEYRSNGIRHFHVVNILDVIFFVDMSDNLTGASTDTFSSQTSLSVNATDVTVKTSESMTSELSSSSTVSTSDIASSSTKLTELETSPDIFTGTQTSEAISSTGKWHELLREKCK